MPALVKAGQQGGGWAYHAYTPTWSQDAAGYQSCYALRYRRYIGCYPQLASVPLILTEGGFDKGGNPDADGYRANGGAAQYFPWLSWLSGELANDGYVKGVTLFFAARENRPTSAHENRPTASPRRECLGVLGRVKGPLAPRGRCAALDPPCALQAPATTGSRWVRSQGAGAPR